MNMSQDYKLTNENLINYARTNDAHEAFVSSVNNGQTRLALEVLVELIDGIISKLDDMTSNENAPVIDQNDLSQNLNSNKETVIESVSSILSHDEASETVTEDIKPKSQKAKVDKETNASV